MATRKTKPRIEIDIAKVESFAAVGCSMEQIAANLGIAPSTLYSRVKENGEIGEAITRGRAKGVAKVANALFQKAMDGDVNAQKYYLGNRDPENWASLNKVEMTGKDGIPLQPPVFNIVAHE